MADGTDPMHSACCNACDSWMIGGGVLVSTDYVVDETLTLVRRRLGLAAAERWWAAVDASRRLQWMRINAVRAEKARRWFFTWKDKRFSFTDCTSFVVMEEMRIRKALTTDRHFSQAGFETVPEAGC